MSLIAEYHQTIPTTIHNPKMDAGYWTLEALAALKNMSVLDLFRVYTVEHNVSDDGQVFYNIAASTIH